MRLTPYLLTAIGAAALVPRLQAQQAAPQPYLLATYYECDYSREGMSDDIQKVMAAISDRHLKAGHITSYGWSAHAMGGAWRRVGYFIGTDRNALLDMWAGLDAEMTKESPAAAQEFNQICNRHQDYVWQVAASSTPDPARMVRGDWATSTYYGCNIAMEARADELVRTLIGPAIDVHVKAGHLASWTWLKHDFGGGLRRALVIDGPDSKTLFNMRDQIVAELGAKNQAAMAEFNAACGNHQDYLWNRVFSKP
jgi:hypothetical protein